VGRWMDAIRALRFSHAGVCGCVDTCSGLVGAPGAPIPAMTREWLAAGEMARVT